MKYKQEIKQHRTAAGLSQTELAKQTNLAQTTISWIERGKGIPNIEQCILLADFYGISIDELVGHEVKKNY